MFILECISNHVKIITKIKMAKKIILFKKKFIKLDFQNLKELRKLHYFYKNR